MNPTFAKASPASMRYADILKQKNQDYFAPAVQVTKHLYTAEGLMLGKHRRSLEKTQENKEPSHETPLEEWTPSQLIARVRHLESTLQAFNIPY